MNKVKKNSDDESQKIGLSRLTKALSGEWWASLNREEAEKLESLLNYLATSFTSAITSKKEAKNSAAIDAVELILASLATWADRTSPKSPSTSKIKDAVESAAVKSEKTLAVKAEDVNGQERAKRDTRSAAESKLQRSVDGLTEQISKLGRQVDQLETGLHHLINGGVEHKKISQELAVHASSVRSQLQTLHQIGMQIQSTGAALTTALSQGFTSLDLRLMAIEGKLDQRIHIRDTIHILEVKQDVERFVEADLIKKISKQVMPALGLVKDASSTDLPRSIADLESRCIAAGLIPLDRLFA
jgi:hypothetical protein